MITEDYVSFETAKLLKEKEFNADVNCTHVYAYGRVVSKDYFRDINELEEYIQAPTLQMATKWVQETFNIVIIPNYEYEYDDTPWCYKIFKLGENGKPERVTVRGVSYDKEDNPTEHIVTYRDYERSYKDYSTKEEAIEEGIKYCLENLI